MQMSKVNTTYFFVVHFDNVISIQNESMSSFSPWVLLGWKILAHLAGLFFDLRVLAHFELYQVFV